jgi:hypothetical protein
VEKPECLKPAKGNFTSVVIKNPCALGGFCD